MSLLIGILQLWNFDASNVSAYVSNAPVFNQVARLLSVTTKELSQVLSSRQVTYARSSTLSSSQQSSAQRDLLVRDLSAILFQFIAETSNYRLEPSSKDPLPSTQVILLDQAGFPNCRPGGTTSISLTGATPLISAYGQNGSDEFCINFTDELLHSKFVPPDRTGESGE